MLGNPFQSEIVVRLRGTETTDRYNAVVLSWSSPAELPITTLAPAEPLYASEPLEDARNSVPIGWRLYVPEGADVTPVDRMRVRGKDFQINGEPGDWLGAGVVITCNRIEG